MRTAVISERGRRFFVERFDGINIFCILAVRNILTVWIQNLIKQFLLQRALSSFVQESFDLHPVKKGFRAESFDFVNDRIDGSSQFDGAKVNCRVEVLDFVYAFSE